MFPQWSLSDRKSPQVLRTLLSILTNLNNAIVWMVSTRPVISKSSRPCTNPFMTVLITLIIIGIIVTFMFHSFYNTLARSWYLFLFSPSLISFCGPPIQQSPQFCKFSFFFVDYYKIWSSGRDLVISLYLEIPEEFVRLIL